MKEYWVVNPINRDVAIYLFEDRNISRNITYKGGETAESFAFAGLSAPLASLFPAR